jgi:CheY-like chemotaxis protein
MFHARLAIAKGYRGVRLLIVEDDKDLNRQIAAALTRAGYAVDRAFDGEEGWFLGDTEPYDAVVLDLGLPKKDGTSVLSAWRQAGRAMPVLILTARDRWSDKVQGFDAGADDYVARPGVGRWQSSQAYLARIPAAVLFDASCGADRIARRDRRASLRTRFRSRFKYGRGFRWAPAQEARR